MTSFKMDLSGSVYGKVASSFEFCDEPAGSINCGEFLD